MKAQLVRLLLFGLFLAAAQAHAAEASQPLRLPTRSRMETKGAFQMVEKTVEWDSRKTALVICDMWNEHWCHGATRRVAEMAPRMNEVVKVARQRGVLIIHCPSDTMKFYEGTPQRQLAQAAPKVEPKVPLKNWCGLDRSHEAPLPIDDADGGCDDQPRCPSGSPWQRQIDTIEVRDGDAVTDSAEAYYLMQQRGIENVLVMGVHLNMCVLGRPFSIRQMVAQGKNVLLMRDLTDTMYNSRQAPYVAHCVGTELMIEHVEKYWCPTVTSAAFLGGEPFRFNEDHRPRILFMIGEDEYQTKDTLPEFAAKELEWRGLRCTFAQEDPNDKSNFVGLEALEEAELLLISVRRRTPSKAQMDLIRRHLAAGKPVVGIRTASHAFGAKPADNQHEGWDTFDVDIFGGNYQNHYGKGPATLARVPPETASHPILTGLGTNAIRFASSLYKCRDLAPATTVLLRGQLEGKDVVEPIAWTNTNQNRRVFYTSLGSPDDFKEPAFRRLLRNAVLWSLNQPTPPVEEAGAKR
jgi:nicotinamidase-related amidase/type 1 glutamine amidotransferase